MYMLELKSSQLSQYVLKSIAWNKMTSYSHTETRRLHAGDQPIDILFTVTIIDPFSLMPKVNIHNRGGSNHFPNQWRIPDNALSGYDHAGVRVFVWFYLICPVNR